MPITIKYKAICDGCGVVILDKDITPEELEEGVDIGENTVHTRQEDTYLVFHSEDCCCQWLKSKGRHDEAEQFKSVPWTA